MCIMVATRTWFASGENIVYNKRNGSGQKKQLVEVREAQTTGYTYSKPRSENKPLGKGPEKASQDSSRENAFLGSCTKLIKKYSNSGKNVPPLSTH